MGRSMRRNGSASSKNNILSRLVFVAVVTASIVLAQSQGPEPVNEFCRTAIEKAMCTKQVKGAKTWHDAVKNAIESTIEHNTAFQKMLPGLSTALNVLPPLGKESGIQTCQEDFTNISDNLKEALGFLAQNDTGSIGSYLTSCNINDCEESFIGGNLEFPPNVAKAFDELHWYIDNCLAVTNQN